MSLRNIGIVYRKELTDSLRDRRTLISTIVIPLLFFPVMTLGFSYLAMNLVGKAKQEIPKVMVLGGEDSPKVMTYLRKLDTIEIVSPAANYAEQITNKEIRAAVEIPKGFEPALEQNREVSVQIYKYEGELKSQFAADRMEKIFRELREQTARERLVARNLPAGLLQPFAIQQKNVAPPEKVGGATFGGLIGYAVILLCMTGAMYPAIDLTAGEKERGTMETILCSPVERSHLVMGKFLLVLTASLASAILSVTSMAISLWGAAKLSVAGEERSPFDMMSVNPKAVAAVFGMVLPMAVFFSAALMTIALFAKSYKEAQSYLTPMTFLVVIPAVASLLPGVELNAKLAFVPILNTSLVSKEIITGTFHWNYIALIFLSSCIYAGAAMFVAVKMFQREEVLFRS